MKNIKPSELVRLAVHDLEAVEDRHDEYSVNMIAWHYPGKHSCQVCLAGAVMAISMQTPISKSMTPPDFEQPQHGLLNALNYFACGQITEALYHMGITAHIPRWTIPDYASSPMRFKAKLLELADHLEKIKL